MGAPANFDPSLHGVRVSPPGHFREGKVHAGGQSAPRQKGASHKQVSDGKMASYGRLWQRRQKPQNDAKIEQFCFDRAGWVGVDPRGIGLRVEVTGQGDGRGSNGLYF